MKINFKLRNFKYKYLGKYLRQIYFKHDKYESNRFTFIINVIAI